MTPEILATMQIGTRKAAPARATDLPLEGPERTVLAELGVLGLQNRAGIRPVKASPVPEAPPETLKISDASEAIQEAIDESVPILEEWAKLAVAKGYVAPPSVVSRLVPLAAKSSILVPVLGERGRWLAEIMDVALARTGPRENPRPKLRDEYDNLDPKERAALISALAYDLAPEDEPILMRAASDKRKEVREEAVPLLIKLPDSEYARQLRDIAEPAVTVKRSLLKTSFEVIPPEPETLPKWLDKTPPLLKLGPKALALYNVIAHIPPSYWTAHTKMSIHDLIERARKNEYGDALLRGWQMAAMNFNERDWLDTAYEAGLTASQAHPQLLFWISEPVFDRAVTAKFRQDPQNVVSLIRSRETPLSAAHSRALVEYVVRDKPTYIYALRTLASRLDLSISPLLESAWDAEGSPLEDLRNYWRKFLDLRLRLLRSLP